MKKQLLFLSALFVSIVMFGQKNELKTAEKAIKSNNFTAAISAINQAESLIASTDTKSKQKFYYLKALALYQNGSAQADVSKVGTAFNDLISYEKEISSSKYSAEIGGLANGLIQKISKNASKDWGVALASKEPSDYVTAAKKFEQVYMLSPTDTSFLDNAALVYYYGKDYNSSIKLYEKLLELNYTGIATEYVATNKSDGEDVVYADKKAMDLQVKLGLAENPREEAKDSRRELIYKNLAQNYSELDNTDKALEIITEGRKEFPASYSLLIDEANIYYKKGDNASFKNRLEKAIEMNPTEPTLYYNVGVMNMDQKNTDAAIENFKKAIELKPDYSDAYNNIGAAIIDKAAPVIEEMNKSLSDFNKYDALQTKQMEIYKEAVPYYEKAYELNKSNTSVMQTLIGLYENLDMGDKLETLKATYDAIKE